jgi:hypothetical protein
MIQQEDPPGSQRNTIHGAGNIVTGGEITNSILAVTTVNQQNPTVQQLRDQLTQVRQSLAAVPDRTADQQDALDAVDLLQGEIDQDPDPGPAGMKRLYLQLKGLIAVLAPVAELIGGVAALEEILHRL